MRSQKSKSNNRIAEAILYAVVALVPLAVFPSAKMLENPFDSPKKLVLFVGVAVLLLLKLDELRKMPGMLVALIAFNVAGLLYSQNPYYAKVIVLMNVVCILLLYLVTVTVRSGREVILLWVMAGTGALVAVTALVQTTGACLIFGKWNSAATPIGTIGNSNYLSSYLLFPFFAATGLCFAVKGRKRMVAIGVAVLVFTALIAARGRAGWLALGLTLPVALYLLTRKRLVLAGSLFLIVATVTGFLVLKPHAFLDWSETKTINERLHYWRASVEMFRENPVFGTGFGSFRNGVYEAQARLQAGDSTYFSNYLIPKPRRVHNDFLEAFNEGGIVGAALAAFILFRAFLAGYRTIRICSYTERAVAVTLVSCLFAVCINAIWFFAWKIETTLMLSVVCMGLLFAMEGRCELQPERLSSACCGSGQSSRCSEKRSSPRRNSR